MSHDVPLEAADTSPIFQDYHARIYRYILGLMRDPLEADDLTQETFLRAYRSRDSLRDAGPLTAWLYRIATHICLDRLRQHARRGPMESVAEFGKRGSLGEAESRR